MSVMHEIDIFTSEKYQVNVIFAVGNFSLMTSSACDYYPKPSSQFQMSVMGKKSHCTISSCIYEVICEIKVQISFAFVELYERQQS